MNQGGMAGLLFIAILVMIGLYLMTSFPARGPGNGLRTAIAMSEAKDALIGRAVQDPNRPGSLPCPDTDGDGVAELFAGGECPAYVGRLPWKTLDLPDLRDDAGETLWYALSRNFRDHPSAQPINSDTAGNLAVYASDGATLVAADAAAIVFAPGAALAGQSRGGTVSSCPAYGKSVAQNLCPGNYLDSLNCPGAACRSNATGPFVTGPVSGSVNDLLLVIRARDIVPPVEKYVAANLLSWLQTYHALNHAYPYPARYDHCDGEHCDGDETVCRGRIPLTDPAFPDKHGNPAPLPWPDWFVNNQWYREIYYSVGAAALVSAENLAAPACASSLSLSGNAVDMVFFTPGTPVGSISRPSNVLSDYLEDAENQDGWGAGANDLYVVPTSTLNDRDRVYRLP